MATKGSNGYIEYEADGQTHHFSLLIDSLQQPLALSGTQAQSRLARQFYPRSHIPGDIVVTGRVRSQNELQQLGLFIRVHQKKLITTSGSIIFNRLTTQSSGYRRLLKLYVRREGILVRGFIPRFTITKRGVFDPLPQFTFPFTVIFDPHAVNIHLSRAITKYYNDPNSDLFATAKVSEKASDPVDLPPATTAPFDPLVPDPLEPIIGP